MAELLFANGHNGKEEESSDEEGSGEDSLVALDAEAPARTLSALNALRKSRQHYDVLVLGDGGEEPAHRALLAAAAPPLMSALAAGPPSLRLPLDGDSLHALIDYVYTGRLYAPDASAARRLYRAAWRLRLEPARRALAAALVAQIQRAPSPLHALRARALPDLPDTERRQLDAYLAEHFDEVCESGALATLPQIRVELLRASSSEHGAEAPAAVAAAVLAWLRDHYANATVEEMCSRSHLVYVDARGELRDCGELPAARGDDDELKEYRAAAVARTPTAPPISPGGNGGGPGAPRPTLELDREPAPSWEVVAARGGGGAALLCVLGRLAAVRAAWSEVAAGGASRRVLGAARARLAAGRCAAGAATLGGRLVLCGGYDRARVLRDADAYLPSEDAWRALPAMRTARARFPAARLRDALYVLGGSDGQSELDSVDVYTEPAGGGAGAWRARARLPQAVSHAAAAADEAGGHVYVVGGWAANRSLRTVYRYSPDADAWEEAPPLSAGRSQGASVVWEGALWALGGCDAWRCLAGTERLALGVEGAQWEAGPALSSARRSVGGAEWGGRLVVVGGSDGAASLRRVEWVCADDVAVGWRGGPELRRARAAPGLAAVGGALYAVGGFDGKEFLSCVECLQEADGQWTTLTAPPAPGPPLGPVVAERTEEPTEIHKASVEEPEEPNQPAKAQ